MINLSSMIPAIALAAGLAACGPVPEAGVSDPDQFRALSSGPVLSSARPAAAVAACFEARATLLPLSAFADDPSIGGRIYRLRGLGRTYEEIRFLPSDKGSTAEVRIAGNLAPNWRHDFDRDRGATLAACASGALK